MDNNWRKESDKDIILFPHKSRSSAVRYPNIKVCSFLLLSNHAVTMSLQSSIELAVKRLEHLLIPE